MYGMNIYLQTIFYVCMCIAIIASGNYLFTYIKEKYTIPIYIEVPHKKYNRAFRNITENIIETSRYNYVTPDSNEYGNQENCTFDG